MWTTLSVAGEASALLAVLIAGAFDIPGLLDDTSRATAQREWDAMEAQGAGFYANFTPSTDAAIVAKAYPPATLARLADVKQTWDPGNLFSRNHNVRPAGAERTV